MSNNIEPLLILISGPSGVGKDTIVNLIRERKHQAHFARTITTRPLRNGEVNGKDYQFLTRDEFESVLNNEGFLEHAKVYGNYYGVPKEEVYKPLSENRDVFLKTDVQGASTIKRILPDTICIFIAPNSSNDLITRLNHRDTEQQENLKTRIETLGAELEHIPTFDYVVINHPDGADKVVDTIDQILSSERCRLNSIRIGL
tara:strand:+ start:140 stop:742 length:603 start_codon:yes stop_codon:yes gene_type:complete